MEDPKENNNSDIEGGDDNNNIPLMDQRESAEPSVSEKAGSDGSSSTASLPSHINAHRGAAAATAAPPPPQQQQPPPPKRKSSFHRSNNNHNQSRMATTAAEAEAPSLYVRSMYFLLVHAVTLAFYWVPIVLAADAVEDYDHRPVLDELHITSPDNRDVNGDGATTLRDIFAHDYWGRPLAAPHSHKSWRPLSVLLFRAFAGNNSSSSSNRSGATLTLHRLVSVVTHAAAAELVGILAVKLWHPPSQQQQPRWETDVLRCLAKLAFSLHPTHVEVTANAANRPHLLALLGSLLACDLDAPFPAFAAAVAAGFLCCETFLFQIVPAAVTLWAVAYLRRYHDPRRHPASDHSFRYQIVAVALQPAVLVRLLWLAVAAVTYCAGRWYFDTLSIPDGLIRPAENPFYELQGRTRVWSYLRVWGVHVYKQWDWDYLGGGGGFSHEYGYDCVSAVSDWRDARLLPVAVAVAAHAAIAAYLVLWRQRRRTTLSRGCIVFLVYLAWSATLFPITGIIKVGTFIADRIAVASTVPVALVQAHAATCWIVSYRTPTATATAGGTDPQRRRRGGAGGGRCNNYRWWLLGLWAALAWRRIYVRTQEWMDPLPLLESSLRTCPRFAKAHLEISKIYSGLYANRYNLTRARWHLEQAESIDPDYCDVHQQFAHVAGQEGKLSELEERLFHALTCPFTMSGTIAMWQKYWNARLDPSRQSAAMVEENQRRYQTYQAAINEAIAAEAKREREQPKHKKKSPLAVDWNRPTPEEL